jgi:hypothetical protein
MVLPYKKNYRGDKQRKPYAFKDAFWQSAKDVV